MQKLPNLVLIKNVLTLQVLERSCRLRKAAHCTKVRRVTDIQINLGPPAIPAHPRLILRMLQASDLQTNSNQAMCLP